MYTMYYVHIRNKLYCIRLSRDHSVDNIILIMFAGTIEILDWKNI